jgi:two-component system, NtrC family, response regulator AtoC
LRPMDVVGSYGSADYEVLLPDTTLAVATDLAGRLGAALADAGIQASPGMAMWPDDGRDHYALLARAASRSQGTGLDRTSAAMAIDSPMEAIHRLVDRVAAGNISVLIMGETGVGKEVLAERIHRQSPRAQKPLVKLNCAALSETLLESELFGHERGAFTGAVQQKLGLLETGDGGTVFLDEIGELPLPVQVKLLRVLEERRVMRVGALKTRDIDVRFVAATNRDLEAECAAGRFRQDLYFRLNGITLVIPPLRDRRNEIPLLLKQFIEAAVKREKKPAIHLADDAKAALMTYAWPGNVRELKNIVERAVLLSDGTIRTEHLPMDKMRPTRPPAPVASAPAAASSPPQPEDLESETGSRKVDARKVADALNRCAGNQTEAARLLGVSRRTLINWVEKFDLPRPRKK